MSRVISRGAKRTLDQAGISSLEFAVAATGFLMLLLAGIDFGRYFFTVHSLHTLTEEAARAALIDSTQHNCANVCGSPVSSTELATLGAAAPFLNTSQLVLAVTQSSSSGVTTISVAASYPFSFITPVLASAWNGALSDATQISY